MLDFNDRIGDLDEHERIRFMFTLSTNETDTSSFESFMHALKRRISRVSGGLTVLRGTGIWRDNAEESHSIYKGDVMDETSFTLIVTLDPKHYFNDLSTVRDVGTRLIQCFETAHKYNPNVPIEWVHSEYDIVKVSHFNITNY